MGPSRLALPAGARPQTAEIIKTFGQRCPQVITNNRVDAANFVVELDHEGGKGLLAHKDKIAVFVQKSRDSIFSKSTLSVGGSVEDACRAILSHWSAHASELQAVVAPVNVSATEASVHAVSAVAGLASTLACRTAHRGRRRFCRQYTIDNKSLVGKA